MQQLLLQLAKPVNSAKKEEILKKEDETDLFIGIKSPLNDPFNVFFRLSDLENQENGPIYFYSYSLGKARSIIWGVYDSETEEFLIDSACKYNLSELNSALAKWKVNNYSFFGSAVRDRMSDRFSNNGTLKKGHAFNKNLFTRFKNFFMYIQLQKKQLSSFEILSDELKEKIVKVDDEILEKDLDVIEEYEVIIKEIITSVSLNVKKFKGSDYNIVRLGSVNNLIDLIKEDLPMEKTNFVSEVYHFILLMMDPSVEGKGAKYILELHRLENDKDKSSKEYRSYIYTMKNYLESSFIKAWIEMIVRYVNPFDPLDLKLFLAEEIYRISEDLNANTVGVIGGERLEKTMADRVDYITQKLKLFLETSIYSKLSMVNNLGTCYVPEQCELIDGKIDKNCGLYEHGNSMPSVFDYT